MVLSITLKYHIKERKTMETTINIKAQVEAFIAENEKFEKGNSAAGTRARKALGELAKLCKARRNEITAEKTARKEAK
jgi:hypothetical protein